MNKYVPRINIHTSCVKSIRRIITRIYHKDTSSKTVKRGEKEGRSENFKNKGGDSKKKKGMLNITF